MGEVVGEWDSESVGERVSERVGKRAETYLKHTPSSPLEAMV